MVNNGSHKSMWSRLTRVVRCPLSLPPPACAQHRWGQPLAILDCLARTAGTYRWVAVMDFDEYLVPRAAPSLPQLLRDAAGPDGLAAQYTFPGRILCSGCQHQFHRVPGSNSSSVQPLKVAEAPRSDMAAACLEPLADFQHVLWSSVASQEHDHQKSIVDPMAVVFPGIHTHTIGAFNGIGRALTLQPTQV